MKKVALYLMNKKGLSVLQALLQDNRLNQISYVVGANDINVINDYFKEIEVLCKNNDIPFYKRLDRITPSSDYKVAIGWRWLINKSENLIVLHDSILPRYRGFAPLVNYLINKEKKIGVTALFASADYDKGDIIEQKEIEIEYPIKIEDAIDKITPLYQDLVKIIFDKFIRGNLTSYKQNEKSATYSLWRDEKDYYINWKWTSEKIKRFIDAVGYPYDGAKTILKGEVLKIIDAKIINDVIIQNRDFGKVIFLKTKNPVIVCGEGLLELKTVLTIEGKEFYLKNFRSRFE